MATDPDAAPATDSTRWASSAIENELPTYRAISGWAVATLVLGVVSIVSFANLYFLAASVAAIVAGVVATRSIRAYPDLLTGRGLANLGVTLGLICGLGATTLATVQWFLIGKQTRDFAAVFAEKLAEPSPAELYWLQTPPGSRADSTPQDVLKEVEEANAAQDPMQMDPRLAVTGNLHDRVSGTEGQEVHVEAIERRGFEGTTPFAMVRIHLEGPEAGKFPAEEYALLRIKGTIDNPREWWVDEVIYPYEPEAVTSFVESAHGHDH